MVAAIAIAATEPVLDYLFAIHIYQTSKRHA